MDNANKTRRNLMTVALTMIVMVFLDVSHLAISFLGLNVHADKAWRIWLLLGGIIVYCMTRYCLSPDVREAYLRWRSVKISVYEERMLAVLNKNHATRQAVYAPYFVVRQLINHEWVAISGPAIADHQRVRYVIVDMPEARLRSQRIVYDVYDGETGSKQGEGTLLCEVSVLGKWVIILSEPQTLWHGLELYCPVVLGGLALLCTTPLPDMVRHIDAFLIAMFFFEYLFCAAARC